MTVQLKNQSTNLNAQATSDPSLYQAMLNYSVQVLDDSGKEIQLYSYEAPLDSARSNQIDSIDPSIGIAIIANQISDIQNSL